MLHVLNTLSKGGPVMVPLAVCSVLALAVIVERYLVLRHADRGGEGLITDIRRALRQGDGVEALTRCEQTSSVVASVIASGLRAHLQGAHLAQAMEEQLLAAQRGLNRRLAVLDTIVTLAPLLGLLGTVLGMISAFSIISVSGTSHPAGITGGVAEALIATATGLAIAIFSLIGYNWCRDKVRQVLDEVELRATQLENIFAAGQCSSPAEDGRPARIREEVPVAS